MTQAQPGGTGTRRRARVDRRLIGWGGFFVGMGALPLAAALGLGPFPALSDLATYWPVLLVVVGLALIVQWTPLGAIGSLVTGVVFGLIVGGFIGGGGGGPGCILGRSVGTGTSETGTFSGSSASVDLNVTCGDLEVAPLLGPGWSVSGMGPGSGEALTSDAGSLHLATAGWGGSGGRGPVSVALPTGSDLDVTAADRFGSLRVDLTGTRLTRLSVRTDFSQADVDLGGATIGGPIDLHTTFGSATLRLPDGPVTGTARADFGSLRICLPADAAVRLTTHAAFGSVSVSGPGLIHEGDVWQSSDSGAGDLINLQLQTDFGSIHVTRGGC